MRVDRLLLGAAAAVLLTACGGGDSEPSAATARPASTTEPAATPTSTVPVETSAAPTTPAATTAPPTTPAPTTAPSTTAAPTTVPFDYAAQYLDWVQPINCAWQESHDREAELLGDDNSFDVSEWPELRPGLNETYAAYRDALVASMEALVSLTWPEELTADIDNLIADQAQLAAAAGALASAETIDQWTYGIGLFDETSGETAAIVRAKLGLPTNLTIERVEGC